MTSPIVLVSRDADGYASKAVWYENESAFSSREPTLVMEFDRVHSLWFYTPVRSSSWRLGLRAADVIEQLESTPWTDMAFAATHVVESGVLVSIPEPERAA
jgi:hypothetical protein